MPSCVAATMSPELPTGRWSAWRMTSPRWIPARSAAPPGMTSVTITARSTPSWRARGMGSGATSMPRVWSFSRGAAVPGSRGERASGSGRRPACTRTTRV